MVRGPSKRTDNADGNEGREVLQEVVNMAVVRTSHRATEERGTIIELTVRHQAWRGVLRASLVLMRKCGYRKDHEKQWYV